MSVLLIDHYDSFVYNLAHYIGQIGLGYQVIRHDAIDFSWIERHQPSHIILSPGPCTPNEAPFSMALIQHDFSKTIPILGVCLGHQIIGQALGGNVVPAQRPRHGMGIAIHHKKIGIFKHLPDPLQVGLYHSLVIEKNTLPKQLMVTALSSDQEIMAVQHTRKPLFGVQFHPESILTQNGLQLLSHFLNTSCLC